MSRPQIPARALAKALAEYRRNTKDTVTAIAARHGMSQSALCKEAKRKHCLRVPRRYAVYVTASTYGRKEDGRQS